MVVGERTNSASFEDATRGSSMARYLPDSEVKKLIGIVLIDADERQLDPHGIKLRLGGRVAFHATGEESDIDPDNFIEVDPGQSVTICSLEKIDFRQETVDKVLPGKHLMGFITPATTMMREGVTQVSTKIDAGFFGDLNWALRNSSHKTLTLGYGEAMFKLTILELGEDEAPEAEYGQRPRDTYQETEGIKHSTRQLPAHIPRSKIISATKTKLDPRKAMREAGHPFDHISAEFEQLDGKWETRFTELHGKWELVSSDVKVIKESFEDESEKLRNKIDERSNTLSGQIDDSRRTMDMSFDRKIWRIGGIIVAAIPVLYGLLSFVQNKLQFDGVAVSVAAVILGVVVFLVTFVLTRPMDTNSQDSSRKDE